MLIANAPSHGMGGHMFKNIFGQIGALWRQLEQAAAFEGRTVLLVTTSSSVQIDMRVFSIQEGWRILFARSLSGARHIIKLHKVTVVIYDRELPDAEWCKGLRSLVEADPVFFILLSPVVDRRLWKAVLDNGGYDVARKPLDRDGVVPLVNGAFALANSVESVVAPAAALLHGGAHHY